MKLIDVQKSFSKYIHRRYHRFSREFFHQIQCLMEDIKPAYLFDLFPCSIETMRRLLDDLSLHSSFLLLKYSVNDLIIFNRSQSHHSASSSIMIIDLTKNAISKTHFILDQIRSHFQWILDQDKNRIDFDNEKDTDWAQQIQPLNHTTVFGYLLGYPIIYYYSLTNDVLPEVHSLMNYRLFVTIDDEILLYSFSSPIDDEHFDQNLIEEHIQSWYSHLESRISSIKTIRSFHFDRHIRTESSWCL